MYIWQWLHGFNRLDKHKKPPKMNSGGLIISRYLECFIHDERKDSFVVVKFFPGYFSQIICIHHFFKTNSLYIIFEAFESHWFWDQVFTEDNWRVIFFNSFLIAVKQFSFK